MDREQFDKFLAFQQQIDAKQKAEETANARISIK